MFTFPPLQSALLDNGAESHQEASALLRSLNLPQHTGMLSVEQNVLRASSSLLRLRWHFYSVGECLMIRRFIFLLFDTRLKLKPSAASLKRPAASNGAHLRCVLPLFTAGGRPAPWHTAISVCCSSGDQIGVHRQNKEQLTFAIAHFTVQVTLKELFSCGAL